MILRSLLLVVVYGEMMAVDGQRTSGSSEGRGRTAWYGGESVYLLMQQMETMVSSLNERFDELENKMVETLSTVKQKQLETSQQVNTIERLDEMKRNLSTLSDELALQRIASQSNHVAQMNKFDDAVLAMQSKCEELQQFCVNNITRQVLPPFTARREPPDRYDDDDVTLNRWSADSVAGEDKGVLSVAVHRDELFVTRQQDGQVSVYNATSSQLKRRIAIPEFAGWAEGLAVNPLNEYLYVTDIGNNYVHRIAISSDDVVSLEVECSRRPYGLSVNREHNILVTCYRSVQEHTPGGKLLRQTSDGDNDILQAIETANGTLLVVRNGVIHGIAELTYDGRVLRSYGNQSGSGEGQMNNPRSLAVDSNGYILVADSDNNRIQVVNPSLTAARTLPLNIEINSPYALCYDESRGRLYVGEYSGQRRVLAFNHVTNLGSLFNQR